METKYGNYLVKAEIGRGGFGRVFSAVDAGMNRPVAIKVLTCEDDPELLSRFQAEAGITGRLAHDNIVVVYEFARQNGIPYLVMELLEGKTLQQIIASEQALTMLERMEIMYQVAEGLQHAHAQGIIHRDIKPGNVMVLPDGRVKIMDFGIACLAQRQGSRLTREGYLIGTVPYMAPEMFQEHEPDKQTDIWAYGVLFYELLTGEHPFQAGDTYAIMKRIIDDEPVSLVEKLPSCPPALAILLQHLLMKDREMRCEELNDVLFDMEPVLRDLRQERAAALAREVEPLLKAGEYENAYPCVKQILHLDPSHQQAQSWRGQIRSQLNRQKADKLRYQGLEHMSVMHFKEAIACFEAALQLDARKSEIVALLNEAKAALERLRQSAELLNNARSDRQSGKLEEALSKVSRAIELDRANHEAVALRDSLRRQIRELRVGVCMRRAEAFRNQGKFDAALAALEELETDLKAYADVRKLREQLVEERKAEEQRRRNAEFSDNLTNARRLLEQSKLSEAMTAADRLCAKFPEQPLAHEIHREAQNRWEAHQRSEAIKSVVERARSLINKANFDEAKFLVADGLDCYPDAPTLTGFYKEIEVLAEVHVRASNTKKVLERAAILRNEGDLYRAMELVGKALTRLGSTPELEERLRDLKREYSEQQYALNLERAVAKGQFLLETGQAQEAFKFLEGAALQYRDEEKINKLLDTTRGKVSQEKEHQLLQDVLEQSRTLEGRSQYEEALKIIQQALNRFGKRRELESVLETLKRKLDEQKQQDMLSCCCERIQAAISQRDWISATRMLEAAEHEFPADASLRDYSSMISEGRRQSALNHLQTRLHEVLSRDELDEAERLLAESEPEFSGEAIWVSAKKKMIERRDLAASLSAAERAHASGEHAKALTLLENLQKKVSDARVSRLQALTSEQLRAPRSSNWHKQPSKEVQPPVSARQLEAQREQLVAPLPKHESRKPIRPKHPKPDRTRRHRAERAEVIAEGRRQAESLAQSGNLNAAIGVLEKLSRQYPNSSELRRDFEAARSELLYRQKSDSQEEKSKKDWTSRMRKWIKRKG